MSNPVRPLPVVEHWDCHSCGHCCRGTTVVLDEQDRERLQSLTWEGGWRGGPMMVREALLGGATVLAKQADGRCVFLSDEGRCRIHEEFGSEAKPAVCRMFPFQLVPLQRQTNLTLNYGCPSAARAQGEPVQTKLRSLQKSGLLDRFMATAKDPPPISKRGRRPWPDFLLVAKVLTRLTTDPSVPLVRRLAHGLHFCDLLNKCQLNKLDNSAFRELLQLLEQSAQANVGEVFADRKPPSASTGLLFRQVAVHFVRSHPRFPLTASGGRWPLLKATCCFARGRGALPAIHPEFQARTFHDLEQAMGPLSPQVMAPLERLFVSQATSLHYAVLSSSQSLVTSYRALVFGMPMALWLLRLFANGQPNEDHMVDVVVTLGRAQGARTVARTADWIASVGSLEQLVAWYAR